MCISEKAGCSIVVTDCYFGYELTREETEEAADSPDLNACCSNPFNIGYNCFGILTTGLLNALWPQNFL